MNTYGRDDILEVVDAGTSHRDHASAIARKFPHLADLITRPDFVSVVFTFEECSWSIRKVEKWSDCPPRDDHEWDDGSLSAEITTTSENPQAMSHVTGRGIWFG